MPCMNIRHGSSIGNRMLWCMRSLVWLMAMP
jgi:hypothetical protein